MRKKIIEKLKENKGATFIEEAVGFLVICLVLALICQVVPAFIRKNQLNTFATNVSRIISVEGRYNEEVKNDIEEYRKSSEVGVVSLSLDGTEFMDGTNKIQLSDPIVVTVSCDYDLGFFHFGSFKVTLKNKAETRSEVYWKD